MDPVGELRRKGVDVAVDYSSAERFVRKKDYDFVFLDNTVPYSQTEERIVFAYAFLIPAIRKKNPETLIIGTSGANKTELSPLPKPDYQLSFKTGLEKELIEILQG
ncbi:hypothetical protein GF371_03830 [Candidatus Woesearchaeota archaeon]|nr:hypothetical protein [Candidatus Woesearchaeota archaeon]